MKIVVSSQNESHRVTFALNIWLHLVVPAFFLAVIMGIYVTTQLKAVVNVETLVKNNLVTTTYRLTSESERLGNPIGTEITNEETYKIDVNILARRLGILEAESLRLNAFGTRIVKMAKLDPEEFAFEDEPSLGGVLSGTATSTNNNTTSYTTRNTESNNQAKENDAGYGIEAGELMQSINSLEKQLRDQRNRLEGMLQVLNGRILDKEVMPSGMPVEKGYISSRYGFRRDPFNGRKRMHKGIDFAGRKGTAVKTVAGGVVQFAGRKGGYGNVVEVDHSNGLVSRYAHLSVINVNIDQVVKKGEVIAKVGSTGRSTGPHLHLEVLKNGKHQNPSKYF